MNPIDSDNNNIKILSIISPPIFMNDIHNHPLIYCLPLYRNNNGSSWTCNLCKTNYNYGTSTFYCTYCDFDLCPNCLGEYQLDQIIFYNPNSNKSNSIKNIQQNSNNFQWQKKFQKHNHNLTLIQKVNKNETWICDNCSKKYGNKETSYYCSLCDYDLCKNCFEGKKENPINPINPNPFFPNQIIPIPIFPIYPQENAKVSDFQIKSFKILNENYINKNLIYSPLSIQLLLSLLSNGLSGKCLNELKDIFLFQNLEYQNHIYMNILQSISNSTSLNIANVVFCPFEPLSNFKTHINNYKTLFSKNKEELNKFIKEKTNNKVENYFQNSILF